MSNWAKLQERQQGTTGRGKKRKKPEGVEPEMLVAPTVAASELVALDCEMVGVGSSGKASVLARCSVVDGTGTVVYDSFVRPRERVTDFRTKFSGVRPSDLKRDSCSLAECQKVVANLMKDKILVGHALENDLKVLLLSHPRKLIRDTARYPPLMRTNKKGKLKPRKLKDIVKQHLAQDIQQGEHSSAEDARAALRLYLKFQSEWEASLKRGSLVAPAGLAAEPRRSDLADHAAQPLPKKKQPRRADKKKNKKKTIASNRPTAHYAAADDADE